MLTVIFIFACLTIFLLALAGKRLLATASTPVSTSALQPEIDPNRYRPMERLLRDDDIRYLVLCGMSQRSIGRLRAERRAIFRKYLASLRYDFARAEGMVRLAMVSSKAARPDLANALLKARFFFAFTIIMLEMRLCFHAIGWNGLTVDVRPAIAALANMRDQWQLMGPAPIAAV